jgi:hypothetical protein
MYPVRGFVPRPLVCMLLGFESHNAFAAQMSLAFEHAFVIRG